jgi:murein biosynthesis integral membrane protein MurJ
LKFTSRLNQYFKKSSISITIGLGALKVVKAVLTLVIIILSAKYFGASSDRDAWLVGVSIITVFIQLLFGPVNETFITKYIHIREEESEQKVNDATNSLISTIIIISLIISVLVYCFSQNLANLFAPGFTPAQKNVLVSMINILIPSLVMLEVVNIWSSILNAYKSYFIPDLFSFISLTLNIVLIIVLSPSIGIYSLIVSAYVSSMLLLVILYKELRFKFNYKFRLVMPSLQLVKPFFIFALPLYVNYLFSQADTIIERNLTTTKGTGSISMLDYARKFTELPTGLMIAVVTTVLTPLLSLYAVKNTREELMHETQKYFRFTALLILPIAIMLIIVPGEIVEIILVRGKFVEQYVEPTSLLLRWYGLGLFAVIFYVVYTQLLIAQKRVYFFSKVVILTYLVKICFNLFFNKYFELNTFPISSMLSNLVMGLILMYFGLKEFRKKMLTDAFLVLVIFLALSVGGYFLRDYLKPYLKNNLIMVSVILAFIFFTELGLILLLNMEEARVIKRFFNSSYKRISLNGKKDKNY